MTATLLASCGSSSSGKTAKKVTKDGKELSVLRVANMTGQPVATGTADTGLLADFAAVNRIGNTLDNTNLVIFSDLSSSVSYNGGLFCCTKIQR